MPSTTVSSLACVIVHYGDPTLSAACVASLLAGTRIPRIIVVSNADNAGTQALQRALHTVTVQGFASAGASMPQVCHLPAQMATQAFTQAEGSVSLHQVQILPLGSNTGFACACNAGLRLVRQEADVRFVWLLNNDTTVAPDAAECLMSCLAGNPRALCGTSVFRADAPNTLELALGCSFAALTSIITPCRVDARGEDAPATPSVDYVYGASMAFSLSLVDAIGFFDEQFFLYYEEHDFCVRAKKAGYAFYWCSAARVWHGRVGHGGQEEHVAQGADTAPARVPRAFTHFHETRSTVLFLRKHHPLLMPLAVTFRTVAKVWCLWRRGELWLLKSYYKGIVAGMGRSTE